MGLTTAYDELPLWSAPFGLTLLDTIRMKTHINVLDIGSGSGFPMLELAERMGRTCMVYGLDPSADAIAMITEKKNARGIEFAKIVCGHAEDIPFPDEYFGLIVSNNGLNNVADQALALSECYRVADVDAQLVLTMNLPYTMIEFYEIFEDTLVGMGLMEEVALMRRHISEKRKPVEFLQDLILAAGFTIRSTNVDGFKLRYSDGTAFLNHSFIKASFTDSWKAFLPAEQTGTIFAAIEQSLNKLAADSGELVMSVPFVCFDCRKTSPEQPASGT
jgi:arsenite methyltransferase